MPQRVPGKQPSVPSGAVLSPETQRQIQRLERRIENQRRKREQLEREWERLQQRARLQPTNALMRHELERLEAAMAEVDAKIEEFHRRIQKLKGEPLEAKPPEEEA